MCLGTESPVNRRIVLFMLYWVRGGSVFASMTQAREGEVSYSQTSQQVFRTSNHRYLHLAKTCPNDTLPLSG